jgi:NhaP-type Na+/H+ or K+/H+ antiporter
VLGIALAAGVLAQSVARHLRIPGIVLLLAVGFGLGADGLGWIQPSELGTGLFVVIELAVAVILFEGGLNLELSRLVRSQTPIRRLVTWGALVTMAGAALLARTLLEWPWIAAALFGSLVVVTGPTVVSPLVRELRLHPRLATVLEAEGVLIDPVGVILAVLTLTVALSPGADSVASGALALLLQVALGGVAGLVGGFALAGALRVRRIVPDGFENIFALSMVLLIFTSSNALVSHSGILAVPIAGVVVGNLRSRVDRDLREFKDQLTVLLVGLIFVLLAADVRLADMQNLGLAGLAVVAALVLIVRPLDVLLCTYGSRLTTQERIFAGWIAPRGIVAAAIATLTAAELEKAGLPGGRELRAMVFLTIACTVVLAGATARPVAALLGVRLPGRDRIGILGVHGLGLELAALLRDAGREVVFVDSNPLNCRLAEEREFAVVFGDALHERTLQRARFESVGTAIGMTPNDALNLQFCSNARELFGVPSRLVALRRNDVELSNDTEALFLAPHDLERWDVRSRHGDTQVEQWTFVGEPPPEDAESESAALARGERCVLLLARRGKSVFAISREYSPRSGDEVSVVVHIPDRDEAHAILRRLGFAPAPESQEPV